MNRYGQNERAIACLFYVLTLMLGVSSAALAAPQSKIRFEDLLPKKEQLPANIKSVSHMPVTSPQMRRYFQSLGTGENASSSGDTDALKKLIPRPRKKSAQSLVAKGGVAGTVFAFEFDSEDLAKARAFLPAYLWGDGSRSDEHPEELVIDGRFVLVLSFPRGDPAAEWFKERLRHELRIPAPKCHLEFADLGKKLLVAYSRGKPADGIRLMAEHEEQLRAWSFGFYLLGEFGAMSEQWKVAERAYGRALSLHSSLKDPLPDESTVWACCDGLATSLIMQKRYAESLNPLRRAVRLADQIGINSTGTRYNLACALAQLERWKESLHELEAVIRAKPELRLTARRDADLQKARRRPEFKELLDD